MGLLTQLGNVATSPINLYWSNKLVLCYAKKRYHLYYNVINKRMLKGLGDCKMLLEEGADAWSINLGLHTKDHMAAESGRGQMDSKRWCVPDGG